MQQNVQNIKSYLKEQFNLPDEQIELLMPSFLETLATHMQNLESALEEDNPALLGKLGHTIKGAFLNLGLDDCATIALKIEKSGKAGDMSINYKQLVGELRYIINPVFM